VAICKGGFLVTNLSFKTKLVIVENAMKRFVVIMAVCLALSWMAALTGMSSTMYRWRDKEGFLHLSDTPPLSGPYETIKEEDGNRGATPNTGMSPSEKTHEISDAITIPLRCMGNHFLVKLQINGQVEGLFILDTGASLTLISPEIARMAGISAGDSAPILPIKTASGIIFPPLVYVGSFTLGDLTLEGKEVVIHDLHQARNISGLIGMDILSDYQVTLDSRNVTLILRPLQHIGPVYGGHPRKWWKERFAFYRRAIRSLEGLLRAPVRALNSYHLKKQRIRKSIAIYQDRLTELGLQAEDALVPLDCR